jgi:hypothetical protein
VSKLARSKLVRTIFTEEVLARMEALNLAPRGPGMTKERRMAVVLKLLFRGGLETEEARGAAKLRASLRTGVAGTP